MDATSVNLMPALTAHALTFISGQDFESAITESTKERFAHFVLGQAKELPNVGDDRVQRPDPYIPMPGRRHVVSAARQLPRQP